METLTQNIIDTIKLQNNPRFDEGVLVDSLFKD